MRVELLRVAQSVSTPWLGSGYALLPRFNGARDYPKERMGPRALDRSNATIPFLVTGPQFGQQMLPFEFKLSASHGHLCLSVRPTDPSGSEPVAARPGLIAHSAKVVCDRSDRGPNEPESGKLGMAAISFRVALQHRLRKKGLPPQGDQSSRIKVSRVHAPDSHLINSACRSHSSSTSRTESMTCTEAGLRRQTGASSRTI